MLGVGAGGLLGDGTLFDVDIPAGENRKMMNEAFDIMLKLWTEQEPFRFEGQYWNVNTHIGGNLLKFHMYLIRSRICRSALQGLARALRH